jgi:hypothetical protein
MLAAPSIDLARAARAQRSPWRREVRPQRAAQASGACGLGAAQASGARGPSRVGEVSSAQVHCLAAGPSPPFFSFALFLCLLFDSLSRWATKLTH